MTAHLYDPLDPSYFDASDAREERDRTFQICSDCRICVKLCPSFKDLFRMVDERDDGARDVRFLTDRQHEQIVDECYQCKLCYVICPYVPPREQAWRIDFPRLMLRSLTVQARAGKVSLSAKLLAHTDLQGKVATSTGWLANAMNRNGLVRSVMQGTAGIARERLLPSFTKVRFSKWFRGRGTASTEGARARRGTVALFPTCLVEYQEPAIGQAVVGVYERNGVACELPAGEVCCGMPWLDAGDATRFEEHARRNVALLAPEVRAGKAVVVPQPTCAYVLKEEYPDFLGTGDARLVADNTFDTSEYLVARHHEDPLCTSFEGTTYESILWHAACHYRAQQIGPKSRDLMAITGAEVTVVERCSAIDGTWGYRAENAELARRVAEPLMENVAASGAELVAGDCHLANTAMMEGTGRTPLHPMQVLARAYGIPEG